MMQILLFVMSSNNALLSDRNVHTLYTHVSILHLKTATFKLKSN